MVLEHVRALDFSPHGEPSNAAIVQSSLSAELDMLSFGIKLSPIYLGTPQSRTRIYIIGISRHRLQMAKLSDTDARARLQNIYGRLLAQWRHTPLSAYVQQKEATRGRSAVGFGHQVAQYGETLLCGRYHRRTERCG